jgi:hypothetical protein
MNATMFQVGQTVVAQTSAQGLRKGEQYRVSDVKTNPTFFGTFVTYVVASLRPTEPGFEWEVVNGHLLLSAAK